MDERPLPGSWSLRVTCRVLTSHARTTPSTLHEYTWLEAETHLVLSLKHTLYVLIQKRSCRESSPPGENDRQTLRW